MVQAKLTDLHRDPCYAGPDEPDDIMPQILELAEFTAPPGLKRHIDAVRTVAGASRANAPHPAGLYFIVGPESGWRKSSAFREAMQGHVEAEERADALFHENHSPMVEKNDGTIPAHAVIARIGKAELRTDATKREQVLDLLVTHRHLIPTSRKGHTLLWSLRLNRWR